MNTNKLSRISRRGCKMGAWLSVLPSTIAGTELSSDEFYDSLYIRYGCTPAGMQPTCDGRGASFNTYHAFSCAKCALIITRHNELRDELCDMTFRAFQPSMLHNEPALNLCRATQAGKTVHSQHITNSMEISSYEDSGRGGPIVSFTFTSRTQIRFDAS
jgi:hypothetical protein